VGGLRAWVVRDDAADLHATRTPGLVADADPPPHAGRRGHGVIKCSAGGATDFAIRVSGNFSHSPGLFVRWPDSSSGSAPAPANLQVLDRPLPNLPTTGQLVTLVLRRIRRE